MAQKLEAAADIGEDGDAWQALLEFAEREKRIKIIWDEGRATPRGPHCKDMGPRGKEVCLLSDNNLKATDHVLRSRPNHARDALHKQQLAGMSFF